MEAIFGISIAMSIGIFR